MPRPPQPQGTSSEQDGLQRFNVAMQQSRAVFYVVALLTALLGVRWGVLIGTIPQVLLLGFIGLGSALAFWAAFATQLDRRWNFDLNVFWFLIDGVVTTCGVYISGGWRSPWFLFYIANSSAAAFVGGRNPAIGVSIANAVAYLGMLLVTGNIKPFDVGFYTALFQILFLFVSSFFFFRGVAKLREKRLIIRRLRDEDRVRVEELTRLTEELNAKSRELIEASRRIRDADRLKSQFLANMSHELRTPMNSIIGFSEILVERLRPQIEPKYLSFLQHILASGQHLLGIINDVLDLSKIEAGRMEVYPEVFSVAETAAGVIEVMRTQASKSEVRIEIDVPQDLPRLETDLAKFKQILYNLLSNAVKFSSPNSLVRIRAEVIEPNGPEDVEWISVAVIDQGIGIAQENQEFVFQEFRQIDATAKKEFAGTGLGLALVRRFCLLLGGTIALRSEVGKGSIFTVRLPRHYQGAEPVDEHFENVPQIPLIGERVLVIEDDSIAYEALSRHLESGSYVPVRARHGDEALRLARLIKPVAITLDLVLPGLDGWEVLKRLKADEETRDIPVVVISMIDNRELGLALGAHDYFVKPVDRRRLLDRILQFGGKGTRRGKPRLLVIDDDTSFRAVLDEELSTLGYRVRWASNGEDGLKIAREEMPDIVVLDLVMPGLSGFEVAEKLKQDPATALIPILVMTSKDLSKSDRDALQSKIAALVPKGRSSASRLITAIQQLGR